MYHFIPSWYEENTWNAQYVPWYQETSASTFDDTVNQIRMFRDAGEETELICLAYMPNLRRFLHRENIYPIPFWSAFDELQDVRWEKPAVLSYEELPWPIHVEWVYEPENVLAYNEGQLYASVEFEESGALCWVQFYESYEGKTVLKRRDIYDDRGFRSSMIWYRKGEPWRQEYYSPEGTLRFYEDLRTKEVVRLFPRMLKEERHGAGGRELRTGWRPKNMEPVHYRCMADLIREAVREFVYTKWERELYVIASSPQHNRMLVDILQQCGEQDVALSFFGDRFDLSDTEELLRDTADAMLVVTDTQMAARRIQDAGVPEQKIYDISPFDTRLSLGKSQQIKELKVFMPLDGLDGVYRRKALQQVFEYMERNEDVVLLAGVRAGNREEQETLKEQMQAILAESGITDLEIRNSSSEEEKAETEETAKRERIVMTPYRSENDLIRILYDVRLIVDVRDQPDLYLQIAGISSGIPQVNYRFTRYVQHQKDGYIIENINYITGALEYYLDGLANWNEALVYCVQEVSQHTGGQLVDQWKQKTTRSNSRTNGTNDAEPERSSTDPGESGHSEPGLSGDCSAEGPV